MKVLIADDDALVRDGLKLLLSLEDGIEVVATAENGQDAFEKCGEYSPDIVLMDIRMPEVDGVIGTGLIKKRYPGISVVILTTFRDDEYIKEALKNGAAGYILKSMPADAMVQNLRAVAKGGVVFQREIAGTISSMIKEGGKTDASALGLSQRETEVMRLVSDGLSNREISEKLYISEGTVRNYVTVILEKLGLRDRTQLAIFYLKNCV
ncbi:MAG TPA: response regulator transcription factor [Ruminiclostridium sp.]|nr:response regulator transcription factor [Ruminiclostridium sp.]